MVIRFLNIIIMSDSSDAASGTAKRAAEDVVTSTEGKKQKKYGQTFSRNWLDLEEFKSWLVHDFSNGITRCKICNCELKNPNKSSLTKHIQTEKHKKTEREKKGACNISAFLSKKRG